MAPPDPTPVPLTTGGVACQRTIAKETTKFVKADEGHDLTERELGLEPMRTLTGGERDQREPDPFR